MKEKITKKKDRWREKCLSQAPYRSAKAELSGVDVDVDILYTPDSIASIDYPQDIGFPGEPPFTRGIYPSMYRGRLWTMRQYSGFATAEESNKRFKFLMDQGNMGLSVAFDLPTQMGFDSDNPEIEEEVGRVGVAISTLKDMEILFEGIPLHKVTTSFTINGIASIILAMYLAVAEKQGVPFTEVGGTIQNDILKEYVARGTYIFPPRPSLWLIVDTIEYCMKEAPRFYPISISGGHFRSGGASLIQEVAFMMLNGITYIEAVLARGIDIDEFAPRLSYLFVTQLNLFEEIAKFRASRRLWAHIIKERFKAKDPRSMMFRVYAAGCGDVLTHAEPENNIVRLTMMTLAGILGGVQSFFTPAYDEAYEIPTEKSALLGLRTQQILAYETGITNTVDPLGGSYYIEWLTSKIENEVRKYMEELEKKGRMVELIERGFIQNEMARIAYEKTKKKLSGEKVVVGLNKFQSAQAREKLQIYQPDREAISKQIARVKRVKAERDNEKVHYCLKRLEGAAKGTENLMPYLLETVKAYGSVEEIVNTLRGVFGEFREPVM